MRSEAENVLVFPDAKIVRRDAALRGDGRGFKHDQARAALRPAAQVDEVPVVGEAIVAGVLAHGRNADAIAKFNRAKLKGRKKRSGHILWMIKVREGCDPQQPLYCFLSTAMPFSSERIADSSLRKSAARSAGSSTWRTVYTMS